MSPFIYIKLQVSSNSLHSMAPTSHPTDCKQNAFFSVTKMTEHLKFMMVRENREKRVILCAERCKEIERWDSVQMGTCRNFSSEVGVGRRQGGCMVIEQRTAAAGLAEP